MSAPIRNVLCAALVVVCAACQHAPAPVPPAPASPPAPVRPTLPLGPELAAFIDLAREPYTLEAWPAASRAKCEPFIAEGYEAWYDDLWCTSCTIDEGRGRATYRFYPDLTSGTCTLQAVQVLFPAPSGALPDEIESAWTVLLGQATTVAKPDGTEFDSAYWSRIRRWSSDEHLAYLYYEPVRPYGQQSYSKSGTVGLRWRRMPLRGITDTEFDDGFAETDPSELALAACRDAGLSDCDAARAAIGARDQRAFVAVLYSALDRFRTVRPGARTHAALVFWLDYLARDETGLLISGGSDAIERLATQGVVYTDGSDSLILASPWLSDLAARDTKSKWGQQAFLKLLRHVFPEDDKFSTRFDPVIERGEAYLRSHPHSGIEHELILELARAHETWWSLAKEAPEDEEEENVDADLARLRKGAETARQRALVLYRRLAKDNASEGLKQRIFRLEHDIDTGQRAYDYSGC